MRRWTIAVSVAMTLGAQAISIAQAASEFSGTWRLNQAKSSRAIVDLRDTPTTIPQPRV